VWLEDYRLTCHVGGATNDLFVIKNLLLYLSDSTRTWLEHLLRNKINDWSNLHRVFIGNFQGTYMRPGKQWELRNYKQRLGESLREYIQCFSKCCTELPV
jgi:methylphosphotriester-DNA--protein-cysteine methyltransferase